MSGQLAVPGLHTTLALFSGVMSTAGFSSRSLDSIDDALARCRAVVHAIFGDAKDRPFDVRFWDGSVDRGASSRPPFTLVLKRPGALRRMLFPPSELAIAESYISGDVDIEGSMEAASNIPEAIGSRLRSPLAVARLARLVAGLPGQSDDDLASRRFPEEARKLGPRHAPSRDAAAIRFHYDIGNEFYKLWLDERMVYSCAYFRSPTDSLDVAQEQKLDLVCRKLRLQPGERLLDIGCGWGGLIIHAARNYGVDATGITLSKQQAALATERIREAGLTDRCRVEIRDYRTLRPSDAYDKISSVGMVEHVGASHLAAYFAAAYVALKPRGLFLNHGIVSLSEARPRPVREKIFRRFWKADAFIDTYVFPDGKLIPVQTVVASAERVGFEVRDMESLREHYAMTLRHWVTSLERCASEATQIVGEQTYRVWRMYMAAAARQFSRAAINVIQTLLAKPDSSGRSDVPLTRDDIYARFSQ